MAPDIDQSSPASGAEPPALTPHIPLQRVEAVVNAASGSVDAGAAAALEAIVKGFGLEVNVANVQPSGIGEAVRAAVAAKPDVVIVLAGDGTAALAAELAGPDGPLVMPLPGGTMNMLPHALYGRVAWREALTNALTSGVVREVSGGEVMSNRGAVRHAFYVASIFGAPALWADAREAVRKRRLRLAWLRARRALSRAFSGRLRFALKDGPAGRSEALTLMCPMVSRGLETDDALEAAALDPRGAIDAFRLGLHTLLGDWREDPSVTVTPCKVAYVSARGRIPAVVDGEPHRLDGPVEVRFVPGAFRALAPEATPGKPEGERQGRKAAVGAAVTEAAGST